MQSPNVKCHDQKTDCSATTTCCPLGTTGGYGCCPLVHAICCSDKAHCCPAGYKCDTGAKACTKGDSEIIMFENVLDPNVASPENIQCPDGQTSCLDHQTCCEETSGSFGCCPLANAVCCADKLHCCPNDYTCNTTDGKCIDATSSIPLFKKTVSHKATSPFTMCPDGTSQCPSSSTCCELKDGKYGCCPIVGAVCCSDGVHCCPNGYTCDVSAGTCMKGNDVLPLLTKTLALTLPAITCDDGGKCPVDNTCCLLTDEKTYGCCPQKNATCCSDHVHCCPKDYTCDVANGRCTQGDISLPLLVKLPTLKAPENVICPNQKVECPSASTCCEQADGAYGCCPLNGAVCCPDKQHCCPEGYTCDTAEKTCVKGDSVLPFLEKIQSQKGTAITCADGGQCPADSTCCKDGQDKYGCCPLKNAVCCSDMKHCCPEGYQCSSGMCTKQDLILPLINRVLKSKPLSPKAVVCKDGKTQCPDQTTCCKVDEPKGYACCPMAQAACCNDGIHCCPHGYTCDPGTDKCTKGDNAILFLKKTPMKKDRDLEHPRYCSECSYLQTCCRLSSGNIGCCPEVNGVCCSDGQHCCPHGSSCDLVHSRCVGLESSVTFLEKLQALKSPKDVPCPDGQSACKDGQTCCKLASGEYGCCPVPNAVCCSDGKHCCPSGYTCDVGSGTCSKQGSTMPFLEKLPALKSPKIVTCPDGQSACAAGQTCCKLASGQYGCCPVPNAVCCSDGVHCCPEGDTCDVSAGTCAKQGSTMPFLKKLPAVKSPKNIVCPDQQSECADGQTCCKLASGEYGCCPQPNAVCCSDGVHCCPQGSTCDVSAGTCDTQGSTTPFLKKLPALKSPKDVPCPDGQSACKDRQTCCKLASGEYGCCPVPNAVCCSDGKHCCPSGYTCDVGSGTCSKQNLATSLSSKKPALKATSPQDVLCPDFSYCPDYSTCCYKYDSNDYTCCPNGGSCCDDGLHCCPAGDECYLNFGKYYCRRNFLDLKFLMPSQTKEKSIPTTSLTGVKSALKATSPTSVYCDFTSYCPDGNTCCLRITGNYGCCPHANGVCCTFDDQCCPSGHRCVYDSFISRYRCALSLDLKFLIPSQTKEKSFDEKLEPPRDVPCPNGDSCTNSQTCCELQDGGYGCCPEANAVCCPDKRHCCPSGETCDMSSGTCSGGNAHLSLNRIFSSPLHRLILEDQDFL